VPRLLVIKGVDEGKQFDLSGETLGAGRDVSNRIKLHDTEVSRRHAEFVLTPEGYRLRDVGSANGTLVNNQAIHDVLLRPGDQIQIGQTLLAYNAGPGEEPTPSDLADRIRFLTRQDEELHGNIIQTVGEAEGSRILTNPELAEGPWLKSALANLGVMYEAIQAVSHILDLDNLLERIMDLIFRSIDADCGCIMLQANSPGLETQDRADRQEPLRGANLEPKALRWRAGTKRRGKVPISQTVVDHVLRHKQGILVSDAARDERFKSAQSLVRMGVREVICVPMKGRHETLGVLYLDTHSAVLSEDRDRTEMLQGSEKLPRKFTGDHLSLAIAIGHQAALAVEETRYHHALMQAERLAAIGQTVTVLSHHIKNILQGLQFGGELVQMGLSDLTKAGIADKDLTPLTKGWKILETNQEKIKNLVLDMLSYSKEREPNLRTLDLNDLVQDVVDMETAPAASQGIVLRFIAAEQPVLCQADPEGIHRAILNVVTNAIDAVAEVVSPPLPGSNEPADSSSDPHPKGLVIVTTVCEPSNDPSKPGWVRVQVRDNGPGIAQDKVQDIFRPFVSTKGSRGTGLGLPVSRKILREHGGDLLVQSQPGQGSTFVLRFPVRAMGPAEVHNTTTRHVPLVRKP
jgi:signal transduction histidine kinase/pSer/pThr/pTyr-binding forkhead associated (FHA) protein